MAESPKFEASLEQLEKLVDELESGELDLEEAMKRFEKGVKLAKQLNESIEEANRRVEKLLLDSDGKAALSPLDDETAETSKKPRQKKSKGAQDSLFNG